MDHFTFPWTERLLRPGVFDQLQPPPNVLRNTELYDATKLTDVIQQLQNSWLYTHGEKYDGDVDSPECIADIIFALWSVPQSRVVEDLGKSSAIEARSRRLMLKAMHKMDNRTKHTDERVELLDQKMNMVLKAVGCEVPRHRSRHKLTNDSPEAEEKQKKKHERDERRKKRVKELKEQVLQNQRALGGLASPTRHHTRPAFQHSSASAGSSIFHF